MLWGCHGCDLRVLRNPTSQSGAAAARAGRRSPIALSRSRRYERERKQGPVKRMEAVVLYHG